MKTKILTGIISLLTIAVAGLGIKVAMNKPEPALAAAGVVAKEVEKPKIVKVIPAYTTHQVPTKKCKLVNQTTMVKNTHKSGTTGGVIGGTTGAVAGGVIGKQIGGNTAGTLIGGAVGLIGGAVAGNQIQKATQPSEVAQISQVEKCSNVMKSVKKLNGYTVDYTYQGKAGEILLKDKPQGDYLPLSAIM